LQLVNAEGSLSQKASRQMLHASSQASWMPPSTKAAADVKLSILALSSVPDAISNSPEIKYKKKGVQSQQLNGS
jgi:hypothetical protein